MVKYQIIERPAFNVVGRKIWISGQDNEQFGQFWVRCQEEGLFEIFNQISSYQVGIITKSSALGISCVEKDPANRNFYYLIAFEKPETIPDGAHSIEGLETYYVPESKWAVFECVGKVPETIVKSEMYAFLEWLPSSEYEHAKAPEMEVYFPGNDGMSEDSYCEFWLPIMKQKAARE